MEDSSAATQPSPIVTELPRFDSAAVIGRSLEPPSATKFRIPMINWALFLITLLTTTMAGASQTETPFSLLHPLATFSALSGGLTFSIPLMAILLAHEMGHYLTSRRYHVDTSLPYFIPAPVPSLFFIGTFGAFIRMRSVPRTRRAMFDIGAAGPWAGFVVSMIAIVIGLRWSQVAPLDTSQGGLDLGNSIIFWSVARVVLGIDPNSVNVNLHPTAFAGWVGILVTTLNLLPIGQLDGGHVIYALFGPRAHRIISRLVWVGCLLMAVIPYFLHLNFWPGWLLWFVLVLVLGLGHPTTLDIDTRLQGGRRLAAWASVLLFVVTFSPVPFSITAPSAAAPTPDSDAPSYSVMYHLPERTPQIRPLAARKTMLYLGPCRGACLRAFL
ncbi:MAG TPA: site-2 protease family protein [Candidatus Binataceae bacterium]|nr:site-2 protease family protein [Candidatus Binataceae bacterium]